MSATFIDRMVGLLTQQVGDGVPVYHLLVEGFMMMLVLKMFLWPAPRKGQAVEKLTKKDEEELLKEWAPESLVEASAAAAADVAPPAVAQGAVGTHVKIGGEDKLNLGSFNFLGFVGDKAIEAVGVAAARRYGIGSCGPRGFYGTIDCHLDLESRLAAFMGAEEAIIYSYGFSTIASVIPAYCKRGDIIYYDKSVSFAIQKGMIASRSMMVGFEHNDMEDLERLLKLQDEEDKKNPAKAKAVRRFIVVEGLYEYTGDIAPLDKLVDLKFKYKVRLFLEESMSFGVLGKTGKGITEHFGISIDKIDAMAASMGNALGSIGGFVCGRSYVIDHQRLSGAGYCYSASLPPLLASAAIKALDMIEESNGGYQQKVAANSTLSHGLVSNIAGMVVQGDLTSPVLHLRLKDADAPRHEQDKILAEIVAQSLQAGVALVSPRYITEEEFSAPLPSIRLGMSAGHTEKELKAAFKTVAAVVAKVLKSK